MNEITIFSGNSNPELATRICDYLSLPLGGAKVKTFSDGEIQIEAETHLFTGNVWILADDGSLAVSGVVAGSALDALRTANPTLGL